MARHHSKASVPGYRLNENKAVRRAKRDFCAPIKPHGGRKAVGHRAKDIGCALEANGVGVLAEMREGGGSQGVVEVGIGDWKGGGARGGEDGFAGEGDGVAED